jgi:hypothetical protein
MVAFLPISGALAAPPDLQRPPLVLAGAAAAPSPTAMVVPLNRVENMPERVTATRVTEADGRVIGAVQKVEIENGKPSRIDIALMGSGNTIALEAGSVRYDAANNVVATSKAVSQLLARPRADLPRRRAARPDVRGRDGRQKSVPEDKRPATRRARRRDHQRREGRRQIVLRRSPR